MCAPVPLPPVLWVVETGGSVGTDGGCQPCCRLSERSCLKRIRQRVTKYSQMAALLVSTRVKATPHTSYSYMTPLIYTEEIVSFPTMRMDLEDILSAISQAWKDQSHMLYEHV